MVSVHPRQSGYSIWSIIDRLPHSYFENQSTAETPGIIELIAERMQLTLIDVLGAERGRTHHDLDYIRSRLTLHIPNSIQNREAELISDVFCLSETHESAPLGHILVRKEIEQSGRIFGLFGTIYVTPEWRRKGVASSLISRGEAWFRKQKLSVGATNTGAHNERLIKLFEKHGYHIAFTAGEMVRLEKSLET